MQPKNLAMADRSEQFATTMKKTHCQKNDGGKVDLEMGLTWLMDQLLQTKHSKHNIYIVGNGGSAAVASHALVDFANVGRLRAHVLHESSLVTCMANDFGYENAFSRVLDFSLVPGDVVIAISSSGKSANICNAAMKGKERGATVATLSGFSPENPLRKLGDMNFWLDSDDYGLVEIGHLFLLHNVADRIGQTAVVMPGLVPGAQPATV